MSPILSKILLSSIIVAVVVLIYGLYLWWKNEEEDEEKFILAKKITMFSGVFLGLVSLAYLGFLLFDDKKLNNAGQIPAETGLSVQNNSFACDKNAEQPGCQADSAACAAGEYCTATCTCEEKRSFGDTCDGDASTAECNAASDVCVEGLHCEIGGVNPCTCQGAPLLKSLSPTGGFCLLGDLGPTEQTEYFSCLSDKDCAKHEKGAKCDLQTPNGAPGSLLTISGLYFGLSKGNVYFSDGHGGRIEAKLASDQIGGNAACVGSSWQANQIIVIIPTGATIGPIIVRRADGSESSTSDGVRAAALPDFVPTTILRPGLCHVSPDTAFPWQSVTVSGLNLKKAQIFLQSGTSTFSALNPLFENQFSGQAQIPNINESQVKVFAHVDNIRGNSLNYEIGDARSAPQISGFSPLSGAAGTYITISGRNFGLAKKDKLGVNFKVYFDSDLSDNDGPSQFGRLADFSFPDECLGTVWSDDRIIVKVPAGLTQEENYYLVIARSDWQGTVTTQHIALSEGEAPFFKYNKNLPVSAGLCKIEPILGSVGDEVSMYGEYFDKKEKIKAALYDNIFQPGRLSIGKSTDKRRAVDKLVIKVPVKALSGSLAVSALDSVSNALNFSVGMCTEQIDPSAACGTQICCPDGTLLAGKCRNDLTSCQGVAAVSSVYAWTFVNDANDKKSAYDLSKYSCAGYDNLKCVADADLKCPNSAGQCIPTEGAAGAECKCCCEKGKSGQCCPGLTCDGACSGDKKNDEKFGSCTGCTVRKGTNIDQAASDLTCNCAGNNGKFCDTENGQYPQGVCVDCTALTSPEECTKHQATCCVDGMKGGICRNGAGNKNLVDTDDFAYCTYYVRNRDGGGTGGNGGTTYECYPVARSNEPVYDNLKDCLNDGNNGSGSNNNGNNNDNNGNCIGVNCPGCTGPSCSTCTGASCPGCTGSNCSTCTGADCPGCTGPNCSTCTGADCPGCSGSDCNDCTGTDCEVDCIGNDCNEDCVGTECYDDGGILNCDNDWPAGSGSPWSPWRDSSTNFELYYCRDRGDEGLDDDLPALISEPSTDTNDPDILRQFFFHF